MTTSSMTRRAHFGNRAQQQEVTPTEMTAFLLVVVLWAVFATMLATSEPSIHEVWANISELPTAVRITAWVVLFPWMAAIAAWETTWPLVARILIAGGLAWATIYAFFPGKAR